MAWADWLPFPRGKRSKMQCPSFPRCAVRRTTSSTPLGLGPSPAGPRPRHPPPPPAAPPHLRNERHQAAASQAAALRNRPLQVNPRCSSAAVAAAAAVCCCCQRCQHFNRVLAPCRRNAQQLTQVRCLQHSLHYVPLCRIVPVWAEGGQLWLGGSSGGRAVLFPWESAPGNPWGDDSQKRGMLGQAQAAGSRTSEGELTASRHARCPHHVPPPARAASAAPDAAIAAAVIHCCR